MRRSGLLEARQSRSRAVLPLQQRSITSSTRLKNQCSRAPPRFQTCLHRNSGDGRIHHQYRLISEYPEASCFVHLRGDQECGGHTRVLAKELGARNIRVNSINPGVVDTEGARAMDTYEQVAAGIRAITPLGRTGMPERLRLSSRPTRRAGLQKKSSLEVEGRVEHTPVVSAFGPSLRRRR